MRVAIRLTAVLAAAGAVSGCWLSSGDRDAARDPTSATIAPDVGTATGTDPAPVAGAGGAGDPYFPSYGNGGYDVAHYRLVLGYNPATDRLQATATIDARADRALRSFNLDLVGLLPTLTAVIALGTLGLASLGTLFAAMTAHLRARELLFPVLVLPLEVPVLLGTVKATEAVLSREGLASVGHWLALLGAADVIFLVVGFLTFEFILEG